MRLETPAENIARDMREGRFPNKSEPQMVSAEPVKVPSNNNTKNIIADFETWYMREFEVYPRRNESGGFKSQYVNAMFKAYKGGRTSSQ